MRHATSLRLAALACAATLALAGCGRRGPLELPDGAAPPPGSQAEQTLENRQNAVLQEGAQPGLIQTPTQVYQEPAKTKLDLDKAHPKRPINAPPTEKRSTFLLDPLL